MTYRTHKLNHLIGSPGNALPTFVSPTVRMNAQPKVVLVRLSSGVTLEFEPDIPESMRYDWLVSLLRLPSC